MKIVLSLCVLLLGQWCDTITTLKGISVFGPVIEANTIISNAYGAYGTSGFILLKVFVSLAIITLVWVGCSCGYSKYMVSTCMISGITLLLVSLSNIYTMMLWGVCI